MTIFFIGDIHGKFARVVSRIEELRPSAVVFLGDLQATRPLHVELERVCAMTDVWWIAGNHDTDSESDYDNLFASRLADRNLDGRVVEVAGRRIAGLGGVFRSRVWEPGHEPIYASSASYLKKNRDAWRGGLPLMHRSTIFPSVFDSLSKQRADVLVSHEAPSCHPHGFEAINILALEMNVASAFHGHHHDSPNYERMWPRLGFKAHAVGLRGIKEENGRVVLQGELDEARSRRVQHNLRLRAEFPEAFD